MSRYYPIAILIIAGLIITSCYNDNEEDLYPNPPVCDTTNVTFSGIVLPIINESCVVCHSGNIPNGNIALETYDEIKTAAQVPAGTYGSLYGTVSHSAGNSSMPKNGNKLSDCKIEQIQKWIEEGTPNN